jgi:hypothetical protein
MSRWGMSETPSNAVYFIDNTLDVYFILAHLSF